MHPLEETFQKKCCVEKVSNHLNFPLKNPSSRVIYDSSIPYDPEGLLGTLTALFLVYLGVMAGKTLLIYPEWKQRATRWITWGVVLGLAAGALCGFGKEGGVIPVNKNLWSLSFVTALGSFAFLLFTAMQVPQRGRLPQSL
jgi:heparan-alpha-glucosaminide N-acetyltransferase